MHGRRNMNKHSKYAITDGLISFAGARFGTIDFAGFAFPVESSFRQAQFTDNTNFSTAQFFGRADFSQATFAQVLNFTGSRFNNQVPEFDYAEYQPPPRLSTMSICLSLG